MRIRLAQPGDVPRLQKLIEASVRGLQAPLGNGLTLPIVRMGKGR